MEGLWNGVHAGFPCSSFSRVRHNPKPGMPGPVRNGQNLCGLPSNTPMQQAEADAGTLMAAQALWVMKEQALSMRRRKPETATVENPPGDEYARSAWMLPEVRTAMDQVNGTTVDFDTCSYMKDKVRYKKPARGGGKLEDLAGLNRRCRCPAWVTHTALTGKSKTEPAAEYPEGLCRQVAERIVGTWKRIVMLEWLRYEMDVKKDKVNELSAKWVTNEERRRKRLLMSSAGPSKKARKEMENKRAIGGSKMTWNREDARWFVRKRGMGVIIGRVLDGFPGFRTLLA